MLVFGRSNDVVNLIFEDFVTEGKNATLGVY